MTALWVAWMVGIGCKPPVDKPTEPVTEAAQVEPAASAAAEGSSEAAQATGPDAAEPGVVLDGQLLEASWNDGDTFSFYVDDKKMRARLAGYNTLESYGPVHRWGDWTGQELYDIAKQGGKIAGAGRWECSDTGDSGGYGRLLVDCPGLREHLLREGMAHVFTIGGEPATGDLEAQREAMEQGRGMWAKGTPDGLVTSLHSAAERDDGSAYDRVCSLKTGACDKVDHGKIYRTCQEVCHEGSCMTYVPYEDRFGDERAECLR